MDEYIKKKDVHNLIRGLTKYAWQRPWCDPRREYRTTVDIDDVQFGIDKIPTADVVPRSAYEQVVWERDTAIRQLREDYGVELGQKRKHTTSARLATRNWESGGSYE